MFGVDRCIGRRRSTTVTVRGIRVPASDPLVKCLLFQWGDAQRYPISPVRCKALAAIVMLKRRTPNMEARSSWVTWKLPSLFVSLCAIPHRLRPFLADSLIVRSLSQCPFLICTPRQFPEEQCDGSVNAPLAEWMHNRR